MYALASRSEVDPRVYHFRDSWGGEVDLVLEDRSGRVVAIEVKARASLSQKDTTTLTKLRNSLGEQFISGVIVHAGEQTLPLGDRLWAIPVSSLWHDRTDLLGRRALLSAVRTRAADRSR